jgi:hypothetical protein
VRRQDWNFMSGPSSVARLFWLVLLLLAAAACINGFLLRPHNTLPSRGSAPLPLPAVNGPPILKLELAWRDADVAQIVAPTPARGATLANIADARAGNRFDTLLFVPCYSLLLIALGALAAAAGPGRDRWFTAIVIGVIVVAAGDWLENLGIARVLDHLSTGGVQPGDARAISNPALVKWIALPVVLTLIAVHFFRARRWWTAGFGLVSIVLAGLIAVGFMAYARERLAFARPVATITAAPEGSAAAH